MFGSTIPFGQSSNRPFGSSSVFGQNSNAGNNAFTPPPFGSPTPFPSQAGGSVFGGTSTGAFGANSSPLGPTTSTFGAIQTPAFGTPTTGFGATSAPTFGAFAQLSNSSLGSPSVFGQNSNGSSNKFTIKPFGTSTPFGSPTGGSVFSGTSTGVFGANSSANPSFTTFSPLSSTPTFGTTGSGQLALGGQHGGSRRTAYSATAEVDGGSSTQAAAKLQSISAMPINKDKTHEELRWEDYQLGYKGVTGNSGFTIQLNSFSTSPTMAQSLNPFNSSTTSNVFAPATSSKPPTLTSPFAPQNSSFGFTTQSNSSITSPAMAQSFVNPFNLSTTSNMFAPATSSNPPTLTSPFAPKNSFNGFTTQSSYSSTSPTMDQSFGNPFSSSTNSNLFSPATSSNPPTLTSPYAPQNSFNGFIAQSNSFSNLPAMAQSFVNPFNSSTTSNMFAPATSSNPPTLISPFAPQNSFNGVASQSSFFSTSPAFPQSFANPSSSSTTSNVFAPATSSNPPALTSPFAPQNSFNDFTTQSNSFNTSPAVDQSFAPQNSYNQFSFQTSPNPFGPRTNPAPSLVQSSSLGTSLSPSLSQPNIFNALSNGSQFGQNSFFSTPSPFSMSNSSGFTQATPSFPSSLQPTQTAQVTGGLANIKVPESSAGLSSFQGTPGILGQSTKSQPCPSSMPPAPNVLPVGTLPAMPQLSIGQLRSTPSIQHGISSMPVCDKLAASVRISSLVRPRHLSQRRIRLPASKYVPDFEGPKVPFFSKEKETPSAPKPDALFVPRENPRALVTLKAEEWPLRSNTDKVSRLVHASLHVYENGTISAELSAPASLNGSICHDENDNLAKNSIDKEGARSTNANDEHDGSHSYNSAQKGSFSVSMPWCKAGEAAVPKEHAAYVEALMPQLRRSDYYTEPRIHDLAMKESVEPGFCSHVKDLVVGHHGYGSIKFLGDTDVRQLDLDSLLQFNNREVIVYSDESKKPPVGQGLNKPAEITLLNIKCIDKKTGKQYINGPKVDRYREMLIKKASEQGAEFVSYDPVEGVWKFRVQHFSRYEFRDDGEGDDSSAPCIL